MLWSSSENTICHRDKEAKDRISRQLGLQTRCFWRLSQNRVKAVHAPARFCAAVVSGVDGRQKQIRRSVPSGPVADCIINLISTAHSHPCQVPFGTFV